MLSPFRTLILIIFLSVVAGVIALPQAVPISFNVFGYQVDTVIGSPSIHFNFLGKPISQEFELKQGLDIQGGMQVVLQADMQDITETDRITALESAREIISRRVDLYGINEPVVQTSQYGDQYRLLVELAGVDDSSQALELVGTTANLEFKLQGDDSPPISSAAAILWDAFEPTGLTGKQLKRSQVQFDPQTNEPVVGLEFNEEGSRLFAEITTQHTGEILGIFIDGMPIMLPSINTPIANGQAIVTGAFTLDQAKQLAIQLNAGALPVPIQVIEQRTIGASLGQESVSKSVRAGLIGLGLVILFMIFYYGLKGVLAAIALGLYAILTVALYKVLGVTLTLPGIAGLVLSVGMAVDSNILIFERMKEELRVGRPFNQAMELGFGRAWSSIKDANVATILTALILINPLGFPFLNTSGSVRGFGVTLLIGIVISLFTGIVVTRTLIRLFLKEKSHV